MAQVVVIFYFDKIGSQREPYDPSGISKSVVCPNKAVEYDGSCELVEYCFYWKFVRSCWMLL